MSETMTAEEQREAIKQLARDGIERKRAIDGLRTLWADDATIAAVEAEMSQYVASMYPALVSLLGEEEARQLVEDATAGARQVAQ